MTSTLDQPSSINNQKFIFTRNVLIFISLICTTLTSCTKKETVTGETETQEEKVIANFTEYRDNGLQFKYPADWQISFEYGPGLYADHSIGLETPGISQFRIMIYDDPATSLEEVEQKLKKGFNLMDNEKVSNLSVKDVKTAGFSGKLIAWNHRILAPDGAEIRLYQIEKSPKAIFASFEFTGSEIKLLPKYLADILNSIKSDQQ